MKQLSALGARRHALFRNPRRMRALRPGEIDEAEMMGQGFNFYGGEYHEYWSPAPSQDNMPFDVDYMSNYNTNDYNTNDYRTNDFNNYNYYANM